MKKSTIASSTPTSTVTSASGESRMAAGGAAEARGAVPGPMATSGCQRRVSMSVMATRVRRASLVPGAWLSGYQQHLATELAACWAGRALRTRDHSGRTVRTGPDMFRHRSPASLPPRLRRSAGASWPTSCAAARERISPEQVGLPRAAGGALPGCAARRSPALRPRRHLVHLARAGARHQGVAPQVLEAVARTLQLDRHERSHLFTLADSPGDAAERRLPDDAAGRSAAILDRLDPFPACVTNAQATTCSPTTTPTPRCSGDLDHAADRRAQRPVARLHQPALPGVLIARREHPVPDGRAVPRRDGRPRRRAGVEAWSTGSRQASPEFAALWHRHDIAAPENLTKRLLHPQVGLLRLDYTNFWLGNRVGTKLVTYTPADDRSRERLETLQSLIG